MNQAKLSPPKDRRTKRAKSDYRLVIKAGQRGHVNPAVIVRPAKLDGDIEISSAGTFVWRAGRAWPL